MSVIDDVKVIETIGATVLRNIFQEMVENGLFSIKIAQKFQKWPVFLNNPILTFLEENILIYIRISIFWNSTASQTEFKDIMWSWKIAHRGWGQDFKVPRCNRYV